MADQDRPRDKDQNSSNRSASERGSKSGASRDQKDNSEWLRDQVGEDHNLSGSSTYRTLPDQPENTEDSGSKDAKKRQSNR